MTEDHRDDDISQIVSQTLEGLRTLAADDFDALEDSLREILMLPSRYLSVAEIDRRMGWAMRAPETDIHPTVVLTMLTWGFDDEPETAEGDTDPSSDNDGNGRDLDISYEELGDLAGERMRRLRRIFGARLKNLVRVVTNPLDWESLRTYPLLEVEPDETVPSLRLLLNRFDKAVFELELHPSSLLRLLRTALRQLNRLPDEFVQSISEESLDHLIETASEIRTRANDRTSPKNSPAAGD